MVEATLKEFDDMLSQLIDESVSNLDLKNCLHATLKIHNLAITCVERDNKFHAFITDAILVHQTTDLPVVFYQALAKYISPKQKPDEVWRVRIGTKYPHLYGLVKKCLKLILQ